MRRILIVIVLFLSACHHDIDHKQQQAEHLVKKYMKDHLTGPNGYEGITFSGIDTLREEYFKTKEGIDFDAKIKLKEDSIKILDNLEDSLLKDRKANYNKIKTLRSKRMPLEEKFVDDMKKDMSLTMKYKGRLEGYKLSYTYKVKSNLGEFIYHKTFFHIDPTISKITLAKDTIIDANDIDWR